MVSKYIHLFSHFNKGSLSLRNRSVLPGLTSNFAGEGGEVTEQLIEFLKKRAEGGVGLIFLESTFVDWSGKGAPNQLGIHTNQLVPGLKQLTSAIHSSGAKVMPQLIHGGRQMTSTFSKADLLAPSPIADPVVGEQPKEMTIEDIYYIEKQFASAAQRAKEANFDGVEIQAGHGYLISQFLSPFSNKRNDEYGGSFDNRLRFLKEIIGQTRELVGKDFPIVCRLNAEEYVDGGIHLPEAIEIAKELEQWGVDIIDVSVSVKTSYHYLSVTSGEPTANQANLAKEIKKNVSIPVITAGRVITPAIADDLIANGTADLVAVGRGFIADPYFIKKAEEDKAETIIPCIGCNACNARSHRPQIICSVNSTVGREAQLKDKSIPYKLVSIGIIGSSVAALEAAKVASDEGHNVTIMEPSGEIGGLLANVRSNVPGQEELGKAKVYYEDLLNKRDSVSIERYADISKKRIIERNFDVIYVGHRGSIQPRYGEVNAPYAIDILEDEELREPSYSVIGKGLLAAETALYLSIRNKQVTFVYDGNVIVPDAHPTIRFYTKERLEKQGVNVIQQEKITDKTFFMFDNPIQTHDFNEEEVKEKYSNCAEEVIFLGDSFEASNLAERTWIAGERLSSIRKVGF